MSDGPLTACTGRLICPAFWRFSPHTNENSPVLTESHARRNLSKKRRLPTLPLCRQYHRRERLNFSVRNGKRWDTAAIATIISELGIHAAQHYIGKRRIIPLTSNQQNIKKQTEMYMKKTPMRKKVPHTKQKLSGY